MKIFASSVYGSGFDKWGAFCFTDRKTRDRLGALIASSDWCLAIGTQSKETRADERGRLLALIRIGPETIDTKQLVDPEVWSAVEKDYGGPRWPHAFPIREVHRFTPGSDGLPRRSEILPRIDQNNLYMNLARHFVELTSAEVERVMLLPTQIDSNIYSTPVSDFASRLLRPQNGPPPSQGVRTLSYSSGPAATYLMKLSGDIINVIRSSMRLDDSNDIYKIGFSNDITRRLGEINAYFPDIENLGWTREIEQWHEDEINAYLLEQNFLSFLPLNGVKRIKGEIFCGSAGFVKDLWERARSTTKRISAPIDVEVMEVVMPSSD